MLRGRQIIQVIKEEFRGESGIIYVQNRKTAEDLAQMLQVNDIKAGPYHAGLDPKTRSKTQDAYLMEAPPPPKLPPPPLNPPPPRPPKEPAPNPPAM